MKPAFLLVWGVYGGTYIAANWISSTCALKRADSQQQHMAKLIGVSATNLTLNISKDKVSSLPPSLPFLQFRAYGLVNPKLKRSLPVI